jgi:hypothetical protein
MNVTAVPSHLTMSMAQLRTAFSHSTGVTTIQKKGEAQCSHTCCKVLTLPLGVCYMLLVPERKDFYMSPTLQRERSAVSGISLETLIVKAPDRLSLDTRREQSNPIITIYFKCQGRCQPDRKRQFLSSLHII